MDAEINNEVTTTEVENDQPTNTAADTVPVVGADDQNAGQPEGSEGEQGDGEPDGKSEPDGSEPAQEPEFFFGDVVVTIDIPDDVTAALSEKGLDAKAIAAELYGKEGKFELSEETKGKLYEAFGKFAVDAYLSGLKATNESFFSNQAREAEQRAAADTERYGVVATVVGGDEGWNRLEQFALENLSDEELTQFNESMRSGNLYFQQLAVKDLEAKRQAAQGDPEVSMLQADAARPTSENGPISSAEYMKAISELATKFKGDRAGAAAAEKSLDERRRAGMARGLN